MAKYRRRGGRPERRVVAEQMLGRKLRPGEVVHHRNKNTQDNRPENLEVLLISEHGIRHPRPRRKPAPESKLRGLRYWRQLRGLSQEALARRAALSARTVYRIEAGVGTGLPHTETLHALARALEVSLVDLLQRPGGTHGTTGTGDRGAR